MKQGEYFNSWYIQYCQTVLSKALVIFNAWCKRLSAFLHLATNENCKSFTIIFSNTCEKLYLIQKSNLIVGHFEIIFIVPKSQRFYFYSSLPNEA